MWVLVAALIAALVIGASVLLGDRGGHRSRTAPTGESLNFDTAGWKTDFSKHSVPLSEFSSGGPPRDGIPPIDHPRFINTQEADRFLAPQEPVISLVLADKARAYPLQILTWHEIVNDTFGGRPIGVTFCPLCNSSVAFDRRVDGQTLRFGTTGNLRNSDLVMWDDKTQSWWQQLSAQAVVGKLTGKKLEVLNSQILSWRGFMERYPQGQVLSRDTGFNRPYGNNPYAGYDKVDSPPFALDPHKLDHRLPPKLRVSAVTVGTDTVVYPFDQLAKRLVVDDEVGRAPVVVFFEEGVSSALDSHTISEGSDVGTSGAFDRRLGSRALDFKAAGKGRFRDVQTGSTWDITGRAVAGSLKGRELKPIRQDDQFWFAIAAFFPKVRVYGR